MDKHSEASLRNMLDELQPNEPVAGSRVAARAVVETPDILNKSMGPGFPKMRSFWVGSEAQKFRSLLPLSPMFVGFFFCGPCCWYSSFLRFASVPLLSHLLLFHPFCRWMCFPLALSSVKSWAGSQLTLKCFPGLR